MSWRSKVVGKVTKKLFGSKTGKKVAKWLVNPLRAAQRSHRFGHSLAPSMSDQNQVTRAYNKIVSTMGKSAMRAAERQAASMSGNSARSASHVSLTPAQALDYSYRRLSDIT